MTVHRNSNQIATGLENVVKRNKLFNTRSRYLRFFYDLSPALILILEVNDKCLVQKGFSQHNPGNTK